MTFKSRMRKHINVSQQLYDMFVLELCSQNSTAESLRRQKLF